MNTRAKEPEVLEREVTPTLPTQVGGTVDVQVATAHRFPRSVSTFIKTARELAILNTEVAESCVYALPRGGKTIEGPSARLAELVAHAWGNLRIQAGVTDEDDRFVTSRGEAWDVEANVAIGFEVRRRITNSSGVKYNDDMVMVTGNAAASIALRNAVFKAVPSVFWRPIYNECRKVIAGDARTFESRRDNMFKQFAVMGVTEQRLCAAIGVNGKADVKLDHMVTLTGFFNSIKDGETTIEEAFPEGGGLGDVKPGQRKSAAPPNGDAPKADTAPAQAEASQTSTAQPDASTKQTPAPAAAAPAEKTQPAATAPLSQESKEAATAVLDRGRQAQSNVGVIATVSERGDACMIKLDTGFQCGCRNVEIIAAATKHYMDKTRVELITSPASKPGYAPILTGIELAAE